MNWLLGLLGSAANIASGYYNSKAEQAQFEANAMVDELNATRAALETNFAEERARKQGRAAVADLSAALAENGLVGASFDKILEDSIKNVSLDALNIRNQGLSEFYNYKNSAAENRFQARQTARMRKANLSMGIGQAAASVLAGLSKYNQQKIGDETLAKIQPGAKVEKDNLFAGGTPWGKVR